MDALNTNSALSIETVDYVLTKIEHLHPTNSYHSTKVQSGVTCMILFFIIAHCFTSINLYSPV